MQTKKWRVPAYNTGRPRERTIKADKPPPMAAQLADYLKTLQPYDALALGAGLDDVADEARRQSHGAHSAARPMPVSYSPMPPLGTDLSPPPAPLIPLQPEAHRRRQDGVVVHGQHDAEPKAERAAHGGVAAAAQEAAGGPTAEMEVGAGVSAAADAMAGKTPVAAPPGAAEKRYHIERVARNLGVDPLNLATVIDYETIGTYSTSIRGGAGNRYIGLIQFGPNEQRQYGAYRGQAFGDQMDAVERYLRDRGLQPGMGLLDIYSTINAGRPGKYGASDRPGATVRSHVNDMRNGPWRQRAEALMAAPNKPTSFTDYAHGEGMPTVPVVQHQGPGKARPLPINKRLEADLGEVGAKHGVIPEVWSGGQKPGQGTGSHRHDHGNAADLKLRDASDGHILNMNNDADRARMGAFISDMVSKGWQGVGAANNYMGAESMHIGGGAPAAWGAKGRSANAPRWVTDAWRKGMSSRYEPAKQPAPDALQTAAADTAISDGADAAGAAATEAE